MPAWIACSELRDMQWQLAKIHDAYPATGLYLSADIRADVHEPHMPAPATHHFNTNTDWQSMTDEQDKALLDVVRRIPPTWTCMDCKKEFRTGPDGEMPWAMHYQDVPLGYRVNRVVIGQICKRCFDG